MRDKTEKLRVKSTKSHRGHPENISKGENKRCKYLSSRRVVLVSKDDSTNMNLPFFNKPCPVLSERFQEEEKASRRKHVENGFAKTFTSRKKRVFQLFNRPNAPHNTNTVIMESQGTPGRTLDLEKYDKFFEDDVNLCGSFLLPDSDDNDTSETEQTDIECPEED
jgi:hypothetical protein